jgi:hypothetical protein
MNKSKLPKSIRKFLRSQKSLIRKQFLDSDKQKELVEELYKRFTNKNEIKELNTSSPKASADANVLADNSESQENKKAKEPNLKAKVKNKKKK